MENEEKMATGYTYEPMPTTMTDEAAERRTRENMEKTRGAIFNYISKFRAAGVTIESEDELRQLTPKAVRDQISETRRRRLGEKFLPTEIRENEARAFANMERTLIPLAKNLQETLKNGVPFPIHIGTSEQETYFDSNAVEDYIEQAATVQIPEEVRMYYDNLQSVCAAWYDLCQWCAAHQFNQPTKAILDALVHDEPLCGCVLSLSPERMFSMYLYGVIHQFPII